VIYNGLDKIFDIFNIMLAIGIKLNGDIIVVFVGVFVASLNGATNAEIRKKMNMFIIILFEDLFSLIGGAVVDDDIVVTSIEEYLNSFLN